MKKLVENEKISQLSEKFKDKSLTKAQRQAIMEEITEEYRKNDTRKPITLYKYHLLRFLGFFISFIVLIFDRVTTALGVDENRVVSIIGIIIYIPALIALLWWLFATLSRKIDREDELAKENLNKARSGISAVVMMGLLVTMAVMLVLDTFMSVNINVTLNADNISDIVMLILWGYFSLESGLFLIHEGRCNFDDESEEE